MTDCKGPYKIEPYVDGIDIHDVNGHKVASIADRHIHDELSPPVIARLLAAAPDLLDALEYLRENLLAYFESPIDPEILDAVQMADAAIRKAKGEAQ
jgi:hypothetical protein